MHILKFQIWTFEFLFSWETAEKVGCKKVGKMLIKLTIGDKPWYNYIESNLFFALSNILKHISWFQFLFLQTTERDDLSRSRRFQDQSTDGDEFVSEEEKKKIQNFLIRICKRRRVQYKRGLFSGHIHKIRHWPNLCTTTTLRAQKKLPLFTGIRSSEVSYVIKVSYGTSKWGLSLFGDGH